jgi:hypothetical protein
MWPVYDSGSRGTGISEITLSDFSQHLPLKPYAFAISVVRFYYRKAGKVPERPSTMKGKRNENIDPIKVH